MSRNYSHTRVSRHLGGKSRKRGGLKISARLLLLLLIIVIFISFMLLKPDDVSREIKIDVTDQIKNGEFKE